MAKVKEGVELLPSGEVRMVVDGAALTLRRPKIGEMRDLWEALDAITAMERAAAESGETGPLVGAVETAGWWREVVATLSDGSIPDDDDDLPVWLLSGKLIGKVLAHWREVPYLPGE
jgi:hypothetical protein